VLVKWDDGSSSGLPLATAELRVLAEETDSRQPIEATYALAGQRSQRFLP
jgi:hypothetical protein